MTKLYFSDNDDWRELSVGPESPQGEQLMGMMLTLAKQLATSHDITAREILVVEDNDNNSALVEDILDSMGLDSTVVTNATEAMEYCKKNTPLLILMDIGLPEMNGLELTNELRGWSAIASVPIIAVTAHTGERVREQTVAVGCDDFLAKPFTPNQLIEKVDRYIDLMPA